MTVKNIVFAAAGGDNTPDSFNFTDQSGVNPNTVITSNIVTVTGITGAVLVSVTGGTVSIAGGAYVSSGTIQNNQTVTLRLTSSGSFTTQASCTLTIGTVSDTWFVTTRAEDSIPNAYPITAITDANTSSTVTSNTVTVTGLEPNFRFQISTLGGINTLVDGGTSALSGTFATIKNVTTSGTGTLVFAVRTTTSATFSANVSIDVYVANGIEFWNVTNRAADTMGSMVFTDATGANPSTVTTSSTITATGFEPNYTFTISCTGGLIDTGTSVLSGTFAASKSVTTSGTGTFVIAARGTSNGGFGGTTNIAVTAGNTSDTFTITTRNADQTPDAISFTNVTNAEPNTQYTSSTVTVTGLEPNYGVNVSVYDSSGGGSNHLVDAGTSALSGTFAASKSATTSASGTLVIAARQTTGSAFSAPYTITLNVSGSLPVFSVTTRAADTTGNLSFTDVSNINLSTVTTSSTVTASGFEPNYTFTVSCTGGTIDVGTSTLSGTFAASKSVTTSGTGTFVIAARATSSSSVSTAVNCVVTAGNTSDTFTVTTRAADTVPDAFSFASNTGVEPNSLNTASTITVTGLEPNFSVTATATNGFVSVGTSVIDNVYSTSRSATTSGTGTLAVAARRDASSSFSTSVVVTITIGGVNGTYTITTRAPDTTGSMTFTNTSGRDINIATTSNTITATGFEPNYTFTINSTGGTIDCGTTALSGTFASSKSVTTSATGTFVIAARITSSNLFNTSVDCIVNAGNTTSIFTVTTRAPDSTPDNFTFADALNQNLSTAVNTGIVTISGLEPNAFIIFNNAFSGFPGGFFVEFGTSTLGGLNSVSNGSGFAVTTSSFGTCVIRLSTTTPATFSTTISSGTVNVGGVSRTWTVTTRAAGTSGSFSGVFPSVTNAELSTLYTSTTQTVTGLEANTTFTFSVSSGEITGGTFAVDGVWAASKSITTSGTGTAVLNIRRTSSASFGTGTSGTIFCNGTALANGTFSITTRNADQTPNAFSFTDITGATLNTTYTSNTVTVTGLEPNFAGIIVTGSGGLVDAGTSSLSGTFASSKSVTTSATGTLVVAARITSSGSNNTAVNCTVGVGGGSDIYTVTTVAAAPETVSIYVGAGGSSFSGSNGNNGYSGENSTATFRGVTLTGFTGSGGASNGAGGGGGGFSGGDGGTNGGTGGSASGDVGGGGGGGIGGNGAAPTGGIGGAGGGFISDPSSLKAALTAAGQSYQGTTGGAGALSNNSSPNSMNGSSSAFGGGGGGAGWYGGFGGGGGFVGGGGGAAGYTTDRGGGSGGTGFVLIKYTSGGNTQYSLNLSAGSSSVNIPAGSSNITIWVGGAGGGGGSVLGSDTNAGAGGGAGGIAFKTWT